MGSFETLAGQNPGLFFSPNFQLAPYLFRYAAKFINFGPLLAKPHAHVAFRYVTARLSLGPSKV